MSLLTSISFGWMASVMAEGDADPKLISISGLAKFGIARLVSVNGNHAQGQKGSIFVRLDTEQGSQPFEVLDFNFVNNDSKGGLSSQRGVLTIDGTVITFTPPGPRVDRIKIAEFEAKGREITFERVVENELFKEGDIPKLLESMKKQKFTGTDAEGTTFLKQRRVQRHSQKEVWLVNDLTLDSDVSVHALMNAQTPSERNLDFKSWGQGSLTLNIQRACEAVVRRAAVERPETASGQSAAGIAAANESAFRRALSELK